jgi:hypothetical protein
LKLYHSIQVWELGLDEWDLVELIL